ncbi:hypothetical protein Tco_1029982 [Tanacetum coccineum]|uniref:Uncharacterized protein n=1 Tax=Tanacetum coccineum TaxID=301880 RepID=A0ABQ5G4Y9_9ASTR
MVLVPHLMVEQQVRWFSWVDLLQGLHLIQLACRGLLLEVFRHNGYDVLDKKVRYAVSNGSGYAVSVGRAIPDAMAWRHQDYDINDPLSDDDYSLLDVMTLAERVVDLRLQGDAIPARNQIVQHTTPPLPVNQPITDKTDNQREVKIEDPKVLAAKEKKKLQVARAATKKKENKKRIDDDGEGSKPKPKKRGIQTAKTCHTSGSGSVLAPTPLRAVLHLVNTLEIHSESEREDDEGNTNTAPTSPTCSAEESVYNYVDIDGGNDKEDSPRIKPFVNQSGQPFNVNNEQVFLSESQRLSLPSNHDDGFGSARLSEPRDI